MRLGTPIVLGRPCNGFPYLGDAGNAFDRAVVALGEAVPAAPAFVYGPLFFGILDRDRVFERMGQVLEKVPRCYHNPLENLGEINPLHKGELRFDRHLASSNLRQSRELHRCIDQQPDC